MKKRRAYSIRICAALSGVTLVAATAVLAVKNNFFENTVPVPTESQSPYVSASDIVSGDVSAADPGFTTSNTDPASDYTSDHAPVSSDNAPSTGDTQSGTQSQTHTEPKTDTLGAGFNNATLHYDSSLSQASSGLVFGLNEDGKSYSLVDGTCTDKNITIPGTYGGLAVTGIAPDAFSGMTQLESVHIPESVTVIAENAFLSCKSLSDVYYSGSKELWSFVDTAYVAMQRADSEGLVVAWDAYLEGYELVGLGECINDEIVVIPAQFSGKPVKSLRSRSVAGSDKLRMLIIPEGVEVIKTYAIKDCRYLQWISLPSTVSKFDGTPVTNCAHRIHVGYAGTPEQYKEIRGNSSSAKAQIAALEFGDDGNVICPNFEGYSVKDCEPTCSMSGHTLYTCLNCGEYWDVSHYEEQPPLGHEYENGICVRCKAADPDASIGENVWEYAVSSNGVSIIGYTGKESTAVIPDVIEGYPVTEINITGCENEYLQTIVLPDTVKSIYIDKMPKMEEIVVPGTVEQIIRLPLSLKRAVISEGVTEIAYAFYNCKDLEFVSLPQSLQKIGKSAFAGCVSLKSVEIPGGVTEISDECFSSCTSLKTVKFNVGLKTIGAYAFYNCTSLEEIVLPDGLRTIRKYAFNKCTSLKTITVPKSVGVVEANYLKDTSLTTIHTASQSAINAKLFKDLDTLTTVYLEDGFTGVTVDAFSNLPNLKEVYIARSVGVISKGSFANCPALSDVYYEGTEAEAGNINYYLDDSRALRDAEWHYEVTW